MKDNRLDNVVPRPNAASSYLEDAASALRDCGSAPALFGELRTTSPRVHAEAVARVRTGPDMRNRFARSCILFAAIASEAYVNGYLQAPGHMSGTQFKDIDRGRSKLTPADKYALALARSAGDELAASDENLVESIRSLFKVRNSLAHPKPGSPFDISTVTPRTAADLLVIAATGGQAICRRMGIEDLIADLIVGHGAWLRGWGDHWTDELPAFDADPPPSLLLTALEAVFGDSPSGS